MPHALVRVACEPEGGGWHCTVRVGDDSGATAHRVSISADDLARFAPPGVAVERLAEESFAFLLEREPRESILREFDLPVIGRYFPGYETEIRRRLGA
jgi:hypothetical protein